MFAYWGVKISKKEYLQQAIALFRFFMRSLLKNNYLCMLIRKYDYLFINNL